MGMCIEIILLLFSMNVKRETSPTGMSIEINKILFCISFTYNSVGKATLLFFYLSGKRRCLYEKND